MQIKKRIIIFGIGCVVAVGLWMVFLKLDMQAFKSTLTPTNSAQESDKLYAPKTTTDNPSVKDTAVEQDLSVKSVEDISVGDDSMPPNSTPVTLLTPADAEIEKHMQRIRDVLKFNVKTDPENRGARYAELEESLKVVYQNDPRISEFMRLLKELDDVILVKRDYQENGGDLKKLLELSPASVLNDYVDLSVDLLNLNEADAAAVRASADKWAKKVFAMEIANAAIPMLEEALLKGEMTPEGAKAYIKEVSGFDANIDVEYAPE